jgi:hypothetical protein
MEKIASFAVVSILLCLLIASQVYAGYNIVWWGDRDGNIPTNETSRTEQASIELFIQMFDGPPSPGGTCFDGPYGEDCYYQVPDNCVGVFAQDWTGNNIGIMDVCESGYWTETFYSTMFPEHFYSGFWDVFLDDAPDSDGDGMPDANDNCPTVSNSRQRDADGDGIGNICDNDSINGTINADTSMTATIKIYKPSCGGDELVGTLTAYAGYNYNYSFNGLEDGRYLIVATKSGYDFNPGGYWVDIPQTEIQSYDFTETNTP